MKKAAGWGVVRIVARWLPVSALILFLVAAHGAPVRAAHAHPVGRHWIAAWATSPQGPYPRGYTLREPLLQHTFIDREASGQTFRLIVRVMATGDRLRVRLSNTFGRRPQPFVAAYVGLRERDAELVPGSIRRLTFHGRPGVTIPAGRQVYSDPVPFPVIAGQDLAISLYAPDVPGGAMTWHASAFTTSYVTPPFAGDHAASVSGRPFTRRITSWFWLDGVDVYSPERGAIVALGDSITDGWRSTLDGHNRWPDVLAYRLLRLPLSRRLSVVDAGIAGNMVEPLQVPCLRCGPAAVARLDRDVLGQAGVRAVIVFEGINDIGHGAGAARVIAGLREIARRVHARRIKIYAGTILPDGGSIYMRPRSCLCRPESRERAREEVNRFIRTSHDFDGVIDFDARLRDPRDPTRLDPRYDSGDHLHPNPRGLAAMGKAVPLSFFAH